MPKITDKELIAAKKKRNDKIRVRFAEKYDKEGKRTDIILSELVSEFCLSQGTIMQILKRHGKYKD